MKSVTKVKLSGDAHSKRISTTYVTVLRAKRKKAFGQIFTTSYGRIEESYLFITKDLIIKSIKIKI